MAFGLAACGGSGPNLAGSTAGVEPTDAPAASTAPAGSGPGSPATVVPGPGSASTGPATSGPPLDIDFGLDVSRLATGETTSDWVEVPSADDACRMAVPPNWIDSGLPGHVLSPEIHVTSIVTNDTIADWEDHLAHLQATYFTDGQEVLVENDRLFLLRSTERGGASHALALNGGGTACGIVLAIDEAGIARYAPIGVQILYTLAENE